VKIKSFFKALLFFFTLSSSLSAGPIMVSDSYARSTGPLAKAGAAYMKIMNHSKKDDRLISVYSDIAKKTELHTHLKSDNGVMKMMRIDKGIEIGAMKEHALVRGGEHIMFMGLKEPFENGKIIPVTLLFEKAGEVNIEVVVDQKRKEKKHSQSHTH
jgi:copper(I)-binding protein